MDEMDLSFLERLASQAGVRQDALSNFTVFSRDQLLQVMTKMYEIQFVDNTAKNFIPIATGINQGAQSYAFDIEEGRGKARFIAGNANDLPRVDVSIRREVFPIKMIGDSYHWTLQEMMAAQFAGIPLPERRARVARRAIADLENDILLNGSEPEGLAGLMNNPAVPVMTVPNGDWLGAATADQEIEDLNAMANFSWLNSAQKYRATTIILPPEHFRVLSQTRLTNLTDTVRSFFLNTNGGITRIEMMRELATAGPGGTPRAIVYDPRPEYLEGIIPLPLLQLDPRPHGFEVVVPLVSSQGGTVFYEPFSACYVDGL